MKPNRLMIIAAVVGLFFVVSLFSSVTTIPAGHRGVKTVWGKVTGEPLPEGLYFTSPFSTSIIEIDIRTQKLSDKTETYTKDMQTAGIDYAVNYSVRGERAGDLFLTVGTEYATKLIPQAVQGTLKNATGKWEAVDIISHREDVREEVERTLKALLADRGIIVEGFQMTDVEFTKAFDAAVEAKVVAIQKADEAKNNTVQVTEKAKQAVITAQGEAQAMKIKSDALSQNQNLVAYQAVLQWDGHLPATMLSNAPLPFLNVAPTK